MQKVERVFQRYHHREITRKDFHHVVKVGLLFKAEQVYVPTTNVYTIIYYDIKLMQLWTSQGRIQTSSILKGLHPLAPVL